MSYYAIDYGTSNSLINYISDEGSITPIPMLEDGNTILRSLIFTPEKNEWYFGEDAIHHYMENEGEGRFLRSLKKFLAEPGYSGTEIHNRKYKIEDLIATFLREMRERANQYIGKQIDSVIMGRPAKYSSNLDYDKLAEERMLKASQLAGFKEVIFCPEPLAAGLDFDKDNQKEKIVLIADYGGGTSDFTLMKLHSGKYTQDDILGIAGIFKAGDALDGEMMHKIVSNHFGANYEFILPMSDKKLSFPKTLLKKICSPAHITHLRDKEVWEYLKEIHQFGKDQEHKKKLDQLFTLVEMQLGFPIFHEIEKFKVRMSGGDKDAEVFNYQYPGIDIQEEIQRTRYESLLRTPVEDIMQTMQEVFTQSGITTSQVDEVVLTGGSAQFNLIQESMGKIFGKEKLIEHDIFQSVIGGLSQFALQRL